MHLYQLLVQVHAIYYMKLINASCFLIQNRRVVLITNVKPGKLRDVMSAGLVGFCCTV